jgi:hypothetical protein
LVCNEWSEKFQQGDVILLCVNIELGVLDELDLTFDPFVFHASEIDATHANQQAFRLDTVQYNSRSRQRHNFWEGYSVIIIPSQSNGFEMYIFRFYN